MFNEKLFYEICEKYGVETRKSKGKPIIKNKDGAERELMESDVKNILNISDENVNIIN
jgi:hypothetical protein